MVPKTLALGEGGRLRRPDRWCALLTDEALACLSLSFPTEGGGLHSELKWKAAEERERETTGHENRHEEGDLRAIAVPHPPGDISPHPSNESTKGLPVSITIF